MLVQETHHEMRIPERDVTSSYLFSYLRLSIQGRRNEICSREQRAMASAVARAYNGGLRAEPEVGVKGRSFPEAEKLFQFARPAEAAKLSYFLFICSILHLQAWTDFLARNGVVISRYWHTPRMLFY